jgi:hypothetical protein
MDRHLLDPSDPFARAVDGTCDDWNPAVDC